MSLSVLTNISSLVAQNNLSKSQSTLNTAIERLSSGKRINSAKDDAAGLAIATRFTTQINGLNQAVRNSQDGISLAQTTESALNQVTDNLQRIRELAVQSANASNSSSDRAALNQEVQQRLAEVTRIAQQTSFNGRKVLDGTQSNLSFQVGANAGQVITVNLSQGVQANQIGKLASDSVDLSSQVATAATASTATATGTAGFDYSTTSKTFTIDGNSVTLDQAYADQAAVVNAVQTQLDSGASGAYSVAANGTDGFQITTSATGASSAITVGGTDAAFITGTADGTDAGLNLASGDLTIQIGSGASFDITGQFSSTQAVADAINAHSDSGISAYVGSNGNLDISAADTIAVTGSQASTLGFAASDAVSNSTSLADASVATVDSANNTINAVDAALQSVSGLRSQLGAVQNRFDSTISNLQTISQNLDSSRSSIQDADFAAETAKLSSAQILQQAGVSVLAKANTTPQLALKLLQ